MKGGEKTVGAVVVGAALMAAAMGAAAAETPARPSPQAALETLLQSSAGGRAERAEPSAQSASGVAITRVMVAVERGQSLDTLIRKHLAASPLRVEVLRDLIHQLNPQAFAPGGGHRLLAGARLQLPTREDQMRHAFGQVALAHASTREDLVESSAGPSGHGAAAAARRGWVRFP